MTVMDLFVPLLLGIWRREFQCCVFGKVGISRGSWKTRAEHLLSNIMYN